MDDMIQVQVGDVFSVKLMSRAEGESEPIRFAWKGAQGGPELQAVIEHDGETHHFTALDRDHKPVRLDRVTGFAFAAMPQGRYRLDGGNCDLLLVGPNVTIEQPSG